MPRGGSKRLVYCTTGFFLCLQLLRSHDFTKPKLSTVCMPEKIDADETEMPGFKLEKKFLMSDPKWQICEYDQAAYSTELLQSLVSQSQLLIHDKHFYSVLINISSSKQFVSRQRPVVPQLECGMLPANMTWSARKVLDSGISLDSVENALLVSDFSSTSCQAAWGTAQFLHAFLSLRDRNLNSWQVIRAIAVLGVAAELLNGVWDMRDVPAFVPSARDFYSTTQHALALYSSQISHRRNRFLSKRVPMKYFTSLSFDYIREFDVSQLEPLEPNLRNLMHAEIGATISFLPYRVVPSLDEFSLENFERKVLVDVGTNEFLGSGASLIRMYEPFFDFDEVHFFEPKALSIHAEQRLRSNISEHNIFTEACSAHADLDVAIWIRKQFTKEDFVVLKYDVDMGVRGPTLEWAFLKCLIESGTIQYVDELFIELHFFYPKLHWKHQFHTMHQAFDLMRRLRTLHVPVHAWP